MINMLFTHLYVGYMITDKQNTKYILTIVNKVTLSNDMHNSYNFYLMKIFYMLYVKLGKWNLVW